MTATMERVDKLINTSGKGKINLSGWECGLNKLGSLFQPKTCNGVYENCENDEITETDLKSIFIKRKKPQIPEVKKFELKSPKGNPLNIVPRNIVTTLTTSSNTKAVEEKPGQSGFISAANELRNQNMKVVNKLY